MSRIARLTLAIAAASTAMTARVAAGQTLRLAASGVSATHREVSAARVADGTGWSGDADIAWGRLRVGGSYGSNDFTAKSATEPDFTLRQASAHAGWIAWRGVGGDVAVERWTGKPTFAVQDVGFVAVGAFMQRAIGAHADMRLNLAYLPVTRFSGSGSSRTAAEVGFRAQFELPLVDLWADYRLLRIDRRVQGNLVPLQLASARLGIARNFCRGSCQR